MINRFETDRLVNRDTRKPLRPPIKSEPSAQLRADLPSDPSDLEKRSISEDERGSSPTAEPPDEVEIADPSARGPILVRVLDFIDADSEDAILRVKPKFRIARTGGSEVRFHAEGSGIDRFGVKWSIDSNTGSMAPDGNYRPPRGLPPGIERQTITITARHGGLTATAELTLCATPPTPRELAEVLWRNEDFYKKSMPTAADKPIAAHDRDDDERKVKGDYKDGYEDWWSSLPDEQQEAIEARINQYSDLPTLQEAHIRSKTAIVGKSGVPNRIEWPIDLRPAHGMSAKQRSDFVKQATQDLHSTLQVMLGIMSHREQRLSSRNRQWLEMSKSGLTSSQIRQKWMKSHPEEGSLTTAAVKQAIRRAENALNADLFHRRLYAYMTGYPPDQPLERGSKTGHVRA